MSKISVYSLQFFIMPIYHAKRIIRDISNLLIASCWISFINMTQLKWVPENVVILSKISSLTKWKVSLILTGCLIENSTLNYPTQFDVKSTNNFTGNTIDVVTRKCMNPHLYNFAIAFNMWLLYAGDVGIHLIFNGRISYLTGMIK